MDEAELLEAWRGGDRKAGGELFDRHFKSIYRFFRSKVSGDVVDDLVQATFEACVKSRDRFRADASVRTFLYAIARKRLYSHFRKRSGNNDLDFGVTSLADVGPTPRTMLSQQRKHTAVVAALQAIPLDMQIAIELYYMEGIRGPALAEALGIAEGTVRSRLRRGLEALRNAIESAGGDAPAEATDIEAWSASLKAALKEED